MLALSVLALLGSNLLAYLLARAGGWTMGDILWVYWAQSVIIGIAAYRRMRGLRDFSTKGLTSGGQPVPETEEGKRSTASFFALHYGGFHAVYLIALGSSGWPGREPVDGLLLLATVGAFAWSQEVALREARAADATRRPNLGLMMFLPYARIIPMHLMVMAAGEGTEGLGFFMALKTVADVLSLLGERALAARKAG